MEHTTDTSLTLSRVYKATPEELWDIWTDPTKIEEWHRPDSPGATAEATLEPKVGGAYSIRMKRVEAETAFVVHGVFTEFDPPHKLTYSWDWADGGEKSEVSVAFKPTSDGTELVLTHTKLSGPESVAQHKAGWVGCFANIQTLIKS